MNTDKLFRVELAAHGQTLFSFLAPSDLASLGRNFVSGDARSPGNDLECGGKFSEGERDTALTAHDR